MHETTVAVAILADMMRYLETRGLDRGMLWREIGVDPGVLDGRDVRIPGGRIEALWQAGERLAGDPDLGLHMAEAFNPGALDITGYVMMSCRTAGDALDRATRYVSLLNDGLRITMSGDATVTTCRMDAVEGLDNYIARNPRQVMETVAASMARQLRLLTGTDLSPRQVNFRHRSPENDAEHRRIFRAPVRFAQDQDSVVFGTADLDRPIPSASPALLAVFAGHAEGLLAELRRDGSTASKVRGVIVEKLKGRAPVLVEVARELHMSQRNLQRELRGQGTSYQRLLDEARRDLAIRHLRAPGSTVAGVAFLLGFSEASAFHRSFRRWTGKTPAAQRRSASV